MKALATNQTIQWFYQRHKESALLLSPDFQRNPVWQSPQKDYLIETILLSLPVPEVYLVNRITPDGDSTYVVVDGQQRLRTIIEFISEEFTIKHTINSFKNIKKFSDLDSEQKQKFWRYPIVVRDLEDSSDNDVRDLFQRLNKYAFVLNDQELRNARFKGCFLKAVTMIGELPFWTCSGLFSANDIRRMIDLEFISILLATIIGGIFHRKDRLDEFYVMYEKEFDASNHYIERFQKILELIELIVPDIVKTRWSNKSDFYSLFISLDQLETNPDIIEKLKTILHDFSREIENVKVNQDNATQDAKDYLDAATYGTNDKDRRIKRHNILFKYIIDKKN